MTDWRLAAVAALRARAAHRPVHGSEARDVLFEVGCPGALIDSWMAERVLEEALEPIDTCAPRPTSSQRAWIGLQYQKWPGYVAGCKEAYYFRP